MAKPERAADLAMQAINAGSDRNYAANIKENQRKSELALDISDVLANMRHLCDRYGLDYAECDKRAYGNYGGERYEYGGVRKRRKFTADEIAKQKTVPLTTEQRAILSAVVAMSNEGIHIPGIFGDWEGLRERFPLEDFYAYFDGRDPDNGDDSYYDPEAGE